MIKAVLLSLLAQMNYSADVTPRMIMNVTPLRAATKHHHTHKVTRACLVAGTARSKSARELAPGAATFHFVDVNHPLSTAAAWRSQCGRQWCLAPSTGSVALRRRYQLFGIHFCVVPPSYSVAEALASGLRTDKDRRAGRFSSRLQSGPAHLRAILWRHLRAITFDPHRQRDKLTVARIAARHPSLQEPSRVRIHVASLCADRSGGSETGRVRSGAVYGVGE